MFSVILHKDYQSYKYKLIFPEALVVSMDYISGYF